MVKDFYIKNMVCDRCIKVLKAEIEAQEIELKEIELGRIQLNIKEDIELLNFKTIVESNGFRLIDSSEDKLVEQVKIQIIKIVDQLPLDLKEKLSTYLTKNMHQDYSKISKVFSVTEGVTIEKYFIKLKIEKVKELIQLLDYSQINHLSRQFKTETGISLTEYKSQQINSRNPLDQIV